MKAVCPECRKKFPWDVSLGYPKSCPLCGYSMGHNRADDDIVIPFIRSAKTSQNDALYREMEQASERRVEAAAQMAGTSVEDMSGLKITNLNDSRHAGDIAAVPVANEVTRMMDAAPQSTGFNNSMGLQLSQGSAIGPYASAGARMRTALHNSHSEMVAKHAVGMDHNGRPVAANTDVTSERPANEVLQPGYRRRG